MFINTKYSLILIIQLNQIVSFMVNCSKQWLAFFFSSWTKHKNTITFLGGGVYIHNTTQWGHTERQSPRISNFTVIVRTCNVFGILNYPLIFGYLRRYVYSICFLKIIILHCRQRLCIWLNCKNFHRGPCTDTPQLLQDWFRSFSWPCRSTCTIHTHCIRYDFVFVCMRTPQDSKMEITLP